MKWLLIAVWLSAPGVTVESVWRMDTEEECMAAAHSVEMQLISEGKPVHTMSCLPIEVKP